MLLRNHLRAQKTTPYIAGLLFFREGPAAIVALKKLRAKPDALIVQGCGINHPRFAGFASHLGVVLNASTIGVFKTTLCGEYVEPDHACHCVILKFKGRQLGFVLKNDAWNQTDLFKSRPPHFAAYALRVVQQCVINRRLPEPLRLAHIKVRQAVQGVGRPSA
ncbi:MAG: endonuclease V [Halobacteriota archaeon]